MEGDNSIQDKDIFEKLSEQLGRTISSYEDLKTPPVAPAAPTAEEIENEKKQRENDKIAWGLANGKFAKEKYESYIKLNSPEEIVFSEFAKNRKAEDSDLSDEDLKTEFKDIKSVMGDKVIERLGKSMLKDEYAEIFNLDKDFTDFETNEKKLKSEGPALAAINAEIMASLGAGIEIELPAQAGREPIKLKYQPNESKVAELLALVNNPDKIKTSIGKTKEQQEAILKTSIINSDLAGFAQQVYEQAVFNKETLFRGIPQLVRRERETLEVGAEGLVEKNNKILEELLKAKNQ